MDDVNLHIDELVIDQAAFDDRAVDDHRAADQVRDQLGSLLPAHAALMSGAIVEAVQDRLPSPHVGR